MIMCRFTVHLTVPNEVYFFYVSISLISFGSLMELVCRLGALYSGKKIFEIRLFFRPIIPAGTKNLRNMSDIKA